MAGELINPLASPAGAMALDLEELLAPGATLTGTPMVPLHTDTLDRIVHILKQAHRDGQELASLKAAGGGSKV